MVEQIKELRVKIDGLYQLTKELILQNPSRSPEGAYIPGMRRPIPNEDYWVKSKEIEESVKSLLLSKAWLGKLLGEIGSDNPYSSGKKEVEDIEPTADVAGYVKTNTVIGAKDPEGNIITLNNDKTYSNKSHIEKVDWLRSELQGVIDELSFRKGRTLNGINEEWFNYNAWNATNMAYNHLCEAKMWLGFEFGRIRDEA